MVSDWEVKVLKHTGIDDAHRAIIFTTGDWLTPRADLEQVYGWGHSISRTQMFSVELRGIPTFVSVHLVRHKIGVEHFVRSNRPDRGGISDATRYTPVNHLMFLNADALMQIARRRLCHRASEETRLVMEAIKDAMQDVDPALAGHLVPMCEYRGGICAEPKPCGVFNVRRFEVRR